MHHAGEDMFMQWKLGDDGSPGENALPKLRLAVPSEQALPAASGVDPLVLQRDLAVARGALAAERQRSAEYAHRNSNLLGMVAALVRRTLAGVADVEAARNDLDAMLTRLAIAHDAGRELAASEPARMGERAEGIDLRGLALSTLAPFGSAPQVVVAGPPVVLGGPAAQLLPLLFFELATNALKHGALRDPNGSVALHWGPSSDGGLLLTWRESGAASAAAESARAQGAGGGSALMRMIPEIVGGTFVSELRPTGLWVELTVPAVNVGATPRESRCPGPDRPERVLVVEDNPLIADDLAALLQDGGVSHTAVALNLGEAQALLEAQSFDLVLLDVGLGEDSSEALLPLAAGCSVAVVSGRSREDLPRSFVGLPVLAKPFDLQKVAEFLDAWRPAPVRLAIPRASQVDS